MKRLLLAVTLAAAWGGSAAAQMNGAATANAPSYSAGTNPLSMDLSGNLRTTATTTPSATTPATQSAGAVTLGNTFQTVLAANAARTACTLQNIGTHTGYVYWLGSGSASLTNTLQLSPGAVFVCADASGSVVKTAIQYTTGTTADPFNYSENQ